MMTAKTKELFIMKHSITNLFATGFSAVAIIVSVASCSFGKINYTQDLSLLKDFDATYFPKETSSLSDTVDLFMMFLRQKTLLKMAKAALSFRWGISRL